MTHYSHNVSRRLLIKQNAHVLFREFYTVHCQWTCFCEFESATYSSKLPPWHMYLLVRQLVGTWAKQRLGPLSWHTCTWHPHSAKRQGSGPINRLAPSEPHWGLALSVLLPHKLGVGLASCTAAFFFSIIFGSVLRHSDSNYKKGNLSGAQLRK